MTRSFVDVCVISGLVMFIQYIPIWYASSSLHQCYFEDRMEDMFWCVCLSLYTRSMAKSFVYAIVVGMAVHTGFNLTGPILGVSLLDSTMSGDVNSEIWRESYDEEERGTCSFRWRKRERNLVQESSKKIEHNNLCVSILFWTNDFSHILFSLLPNPPLLPYSIAINNHRYTQSSL